MLLYAGRESPDEASIAIRAGADRAGPSPRTRCHQKIRWQAQARTTARGVSTRVTLSCHECTGSQYPALDITEFSTTIRTSANLENDTNGAAKGHALKQHLMTCTQQRRLAGRRRSARDREEAHGSDLDDDVVQGWYVRLNAGSSCTRRRSSSSPRARGARSRVRRLRDAAVPRRARAPDPAARP